MLRTCRLAHLSACASVCPESVLCVAKLLIGFGCRLGWCGVDRGKGVLDGGDDRQRGRGGFGMNLGRPIVTNGNMLLSYAEVRAAIELSFGVVNGVTPGIHALDGKGAV